MKKIKILIVDDHAVMRMGLAAILNTKEEFSVVGEAEDGESAIRKARKLQPDIVILDLLMPGMDGAATTVALAKTVPSTKILIFTSFGSANGIAHALEAGAAGAILKSIDYSQLVKAIRAVVAGERVIAPEIERILHDSPPVPELTTRQLEILTSMARGLTDADIATELALSAPSIRDHVNAIFAKLGAANRTEAVAIALRKHLLKM